MVTLPLDCFGQIAAHKRPHLLLDALEASSDRRWRLKIVGGMQPSERGAYEVALRERVSQVEGTVEVLDRVGDR